MRRLCVALALFILVGCGVAEGAEAPPGELTVEVLYPLLPEEARFIVSWSAPAVGPRQLELERYEVRVTLADVDIYERTNVPHPQTADTVAVPWPELGETEGPYRAHVRAVDSAGAASSWASSSEWNVTGVALPPSPPGDVDVDSIPEAISMLVLPQEFEMYVGEEFQLCAYAAMSDGSWILHADLEECEVRLLEHLSQEALRLTGDRSNARATGAPVQLRFWPHVVAVGPGHSPEVCSARLYSSGRLDYAPQCLEEAVAWARGRVELPVPDLRVAMGR